MPLRRHFGLRGDPTATYLDGAVYPNPVTIDAGAITAFTAANLGGARMVLDMPMMLEQHLNRHYDQWWTDPSFIHKDMPRYHPESYVRYKTREGKIGWQSSIDRDYRRTTRGLRDESGRVWETRSSLLTKEEGIAA